MSDFRLSPSRNSEWIATGGKFSNFEFVDRYFKSHQILRRILSLARKLDYQGLLQEDIIESDCALLATENAALAERLPDFAGSEVKRLSFFAGSTPSNPGAFLGYAVFKNDQHATGPFGHVYEAILTQPRGRGQNNFVHCRRTYTVNTSIGSFEIQGVLYAQQNDATTVCAHVALRSLLSCCVSAGDVSYEEINKIAGVRHSDVQLQVGGRGRTITRGLRPDQIELVLAKLGVTAEIFPNEPASGLKLPSGVEFQRLLYGYLESGLPLLLGFELAPDQPGTPGSRHIIPIFGHTFNEDLCVPEAERAYFGHDRGYFPSESWLSTYVAHDDNFGPYICMPRHYLKEGHFRLLVGCYRAPVSLPVADAEALAFDFATQICAMAENSAIEWLGRMAAFGKAGLFVLRTLMVDRPDYEAHLRTLRDRDNRDLEDAVLNQLIAIIPEKILLVELSAPELFPASRRKFGELLVNPHAVSDGDAVVAFRMPGFVVMRDSGTWTSRHTQLQGHTDLFDLSAFSPKL